MSLVAAVLLIVSFSGADARGAELPAPGPLTVVSPSLLFGTPSAVRIVLGNSQGPVHWTLRSRSGSELAAGTDVGGANDVLGVTVPADGYYTVDIADDRDSVRANFLVGARPQTSDRFFSVATHWGKSSFASSTWPPPTTAPLLYGLGFGDVRDETSWMSVERSRGRLTMPQYVQDLHATTAKYGLHMMFVAGYGNPVAYAKEMTQVLSPPTSDEGRQGYVDYINAVLDADPQIDKVEVWNEFNRPQRNTSTCQSGACYATLVKAVDEGVKARHPQVKIVAGDSSGTPLTWFGDFIDAGGLSHCDMLSTHGYARDLDSTLADITALDALVKSRDGGVSKPLVVSEIGVSDTTSTARSGNIARVPTEERAATALVKIFVGLRAVPSVAQTVWYDGVDDGTRPSETEDNFGLYRQPTDTVSAFQPKEGAAAAGYLMRQLEGYSFSSWQSLGSDVRMYTFVNANGEQRRVLWRDAPYADADTGPVSIAVTVRSDYRTTMTSLSGEVVGTQLAPGTPTIPVGTEPIYLDETASTP